VENSRDENAVVDWIVLLAIHICREEALFQRPEDVLSSGSGRRDQELRIYVGADLDC